MNPESLVMVAPLAVTSTRTRTRVYTQNPYCRANLDGSQFYRVAVNRAAVALRLKKNRRRVSQSDARNDDFESSHDLQGVPGIFFDDITSPPVARRYVDFILNDGERLVDLHTFLTSHNVNCTIIGFIS